MESASLAGFSIEAMRAYRKLLVKFQHFQQHQGGPATLQLPMCSGDVFIHTNPASQTFTVEWFSSQKKEDCFGFRIHADQRVYGPYHIH
jgi:hypothetical protein